MRSIDPVALQALALLLADGAPGATGVREVLSERLGVKPHGKPRAVGHGYPSVSRKVAERVLELLIGHRPPAHAPLDRIDGRVGPQQQAAVGVTLLKDT